MKGRLRVKGFRGIQAEPDETCSITEGEGLYIAHSVELARIFGTDIEVIEYFEPENPLIVDNEILYLLENDPEIFEPECENDSVWTKLNKQASKIGRKGEFSTLPNNRIAKKLTELIRQAGYDAVRITFNKLMLNGTPTKWDVLINEGMVIETHPLETPIAMPQIGVSNGCVSSTFRYLI